MRRVGRRRSGRDGIMMDRAAMLRELLAPYRKILIYAVDPGAVAMFRAVTDLLGTDTVVEWFVDGWAARQNDAGHQPAAHLSTTLGMSGKETVLLLGSQVDFPRTWDVLDLSLSSKVKSVFFFDHWKNYHRHFCPDDGRNPILPDKIVLPDAFCEQGLIAALAAMGILAETIQGRLRVLDHFAIAASVDRIAALPANQLADASSALNPTGAPLIVVLLDPTERQPRDGGYDWRDAMAAMRDHARRHGANGRFLIKPHPRQEPETLLAHMELWAAAGLDAALVSTDADMLIALAGAVWGMTSVALVTAKAVGKPILSFQPNRNHLGREESNPHIEPFTITDSARTC